MPTGIKCPRFNPRNRSRNHNIRHRTISPKQTVSNTRHPVWNHNIRIVSKITVNRIVYDDKTIFIRKFRALLKRPPVNFWAKGKEEVRAIPIDLEKRRLADFSNEKRDMYAVNFATVDGQRVYGWLGVPKTGAAPYPTIVNVAWAGIGFAPDPQTVDEGFVVLTLNVFPYEVPIDEKVRENAMFMRSLTADANALAARAKSEPVKAACKKVVEAVRYSDPMSNEALYGVESQITTEFSALQSAVIADSAEDAAASAGELLGLLKERNEKCKLLK